MHYLDGIRGWGAVTVVFYHFFVDAFPWNAPTGAALHRCFALNGTLAVYVFFVISGISLSTSYSKTPDSASLRRLIFARYPRLTVPILSICLCVYFLFQLHLAIPPEQLPPRFQLQTPTLLHTIAFGLFGVYFNYSRAVTLDPPLWSMAFEFSGSALVFAALLVCGRYRYRLQLYLLLVAVLLLSSPIYSTFAFGVFLAGFLAVRFADKFLSWIQISGLILLLAGAGLASMLPASSARPYAVVAGILTYGFVVSPGCRRFFSAPISQYFGRVSYSLYLVHAPLMLTFSLRMFRWFGTGFAAWLAVNFASIGLAFLAAHLFLPIDQFGRRSARKLACYCDQRLLESLSRIRNGRTVAAAADR